ncbi:unnamed protein product [Rotaria sp. Silwood2]|nr:unnamed protein product [Rotaria sp. Silwood2]
MILDSPPIRLIKVLCRQFDETIQHTFCDKEPSTPYPTLVCIEDRIHVYVDFNPVISTTSPDDALALLVAMYTIFELSFDKKSRTIRFLYSVLHGDTQFLSNFIRILIKEKNIDIHRKQCQILSTSSNAVSNSSTTLIVESQAQSQIEINPLGNFAVEYDPSIVNRSIEPKPLNNNLNSNSENSIDINECNNNIENTSSSNFNPQQQTQRKQNSNLDDQNQTFTNHASQKNHQLSTPDDLPLSNITNSTSTSRRIKRKR